MRFCLIYLQGKIDGTDRLDMERTVEESNIYSLEDLLVNDNATSLARKETEFWERH